MCPFKTVMLACRFILTVTTVSPYQQVYVLKKQTEFFCDHSASCFLTQYKCEYKLVGKQKMVL